MKKILVVTGIFPPDVGGSATYSEKILNELPKDSFMVDILTYGEKRSPNVFGVSRKYPMGIRHLIFFIKLVRLARRYDLLLAADSSFGAASIAALAAKLTGRKLAVRVTGDYAWEQGVQRFGVTDLIDDFQKKSYGWRVWLLRQFQNFAVKNAAAVIAPSEYLRKMAVGWGAPPERSYVIYNGVKIRECGAKGDIRRELSIPSGEFVLISSARLVPWKGFPVLIRVFADFSAAKKDCRLFIAGDGPEKNNLLRLMDELNLKEKVVFLGALPRNVLFGYLRAADLFVLNTGYEGFSHQIAEAMAAGLPVVTTDTGGNPELIKNNHTGILVEYNNQEMFKAALENLYIYSDERRRLGQAATAAVSAFTDELMVKKTAELLTKL